VARQQGDKLDTVAAPFRLNVQYLSFGTALSNQLGKCNGHIGGVNVGLDFMSEVVTQFYNNQDMLLLR